MKKLFTTLLALTFLLAGCSPAKIDTPEQTPPAPTQSDSQGITITDQIGRTVTLDAPATKIVSSYYISTATLVALGLEDSLIGIEAKAETRELYKKASPQLLDLPAIGTGKGVNIEEIATLAPELVILPQKLKDSVSAFEDLEIPVIVVDPETMDNFKTCISILATATGTEEKGQQLLAYYNEKMDMVANLTASLENRPTVYLSGGSDYYSTCTSKMYQNQLIDLAGGNNVSKDLTDGYWQTISPEQLNLWQPEYFFAVSYGQYTLDQIKADVAISEVPAIKNNNLLVFPSTIEPWDYPTPSSVLGVLYLTHTLHPDVFTQEEYIEEATNFYTTFFDITVAESDLGLN